MLKTVLVTTNWPSDRDAVLEHREKEMKGEHWKTLIENGLDVRRFQRTRSSAWDVIHPLLQGIPSLVQHNDTDDHLYRQIQKKSMRTVTRTLTSDISRAHTLSYRPTASNLIGQEVKDIVIPCVSDHWS